MTLHRSTPTIAALLASAFLLAPAPDAAPIQQATPSTASAAAKPARTSPFLWRIEGPSAKGYLFGTIHLPDERVLALPETVVQALNSSTALYAEIPTDAKSEMRVQRAAVIEGGKTVDTIVGAPTWERVRARFTAAGVDPLITASLSGMKPWAVNAMVPMAEYLPDLILGKAPLDKALYRRAQKEGKAVGGLETVEEQIAVFEAFTQAEQVQMLRESLDLLDRYEAEGRKPMQETVTAWLSGDEARLMALLDDGFGTDPGLRERAEAELLWKRNVRFVDRIVKRFEADGPKATTFFAIGALHMPDAPAPKTGQQGTPAETPEAKAARAKKLGIVTLLRQRGYVVERVEAAAVSAGAGQGG
ncbi:MAG: TraB/GumN family protein [Planctomycetota bacterium]